MTPTFNAITIGLFLFSSLFMISSEIEILSSVGYVFLIVGYVFLIGGMILSGIEILEIKFKNKDKKHQDTKSNISSQRHEIWNKVLDCSE